MHKGIGSQITRALVTAIVVGAATTAWSASSSASDAAEALTVPTVRVAAAGDIATASLKSQATADLIVADSAEAVLPLGDLAYPDGTTQQFVDYYAPTWGVLDPISYPVPGNHEYDAPDGAAQPYFDYFGGRAHGPDGYYAYSLGAWQMIALNSELPTGVGSEQYRFLEGVLSQSTAPCTLAYWHRARFATSNSLGSDKMGDFWSLLHRYGADLVLSGHAHHYERFAPQDAARNPDPTAPVQIVSGLGGASRHRNFDNVAPNSLVRYGDSFGVAFLDLADGSYNLSFETVTGAVQDAQTGVPCHGAGGEPPPPPPPDECPVVRSVATTPASPAEGRIEACASEAGEYRVQVVAKKADGTKLKIFDDRRVALEGFLAEVGAWTLAEPGTYSVVSRLNRSGTLVAKSQIDVTVGDGEPAPPTDACPLVRSMATTPALPVEGSVEACVGDPGLYRVQVVAKAADGTVSRISDERNVQLDGTIAHVGSWVLSQPGDYTVVSKLNQSGSLIAKSEIDVTVT